MNQDEKPDRRPHLEVDLRGLIEALGDHLLPTRESLIQEFLQNATDAIVLRASRDDHFRLEDGRIAFRTDSKSRRLSISDNGVGITPAQLEVAFGLLASRSKSDELISAAGSGAAQMKDLIAGFGTGLLSTFVLSDELEVLSRPFPEMGAFRVILDLQGQWTISEGSRDDYGTTVSLSVNGAGQFLIEAPAIEQLVLRYCRLVPVPIYLNDTQSPIWPGRQRLPKTTPTERLIEETAEVLSRERLAFQVRPVIGGLQPDFVVYGPNGRSVVLEVRSVLQEPGYIARALRQIERYRLATGAAAVLLVTSDDETPGGSTPLTSLANLPASIRREFSRPKPHAIPKPMFFNSQTIFAAMPFSDEYDDTYFVAMVPAAEQLRTACVRVDKEEYSGDIVGKIQSLIRESAAVIGDLSESKPNVLYELGYAHALEKPVVHISSTGSSSLPFDVRNWNTIHYQKGRTHVLREALVKRLRAILS